MWNRDEIIRSIRNVKALKTPKLNHSCQNVLLSVLLHPCMVPGCATGRPLGKSGRRAGSRPLERSHTRIIGPMQPTLVVALAAHTLATTQVDNTEKPLDTM